MFKICLKCVASPFCRRKIAIGSVSKEKTFDEFQNEGAPPPPQQSDPGLLDKIMLTVLVWLYCGVLLIN